ncbi:MAG: hypothetical protein BAJALOKI2v1_100063 [Promethearchaeota archaeon]|nr:MAG: hypothetical protein BAJALOKI2v1_100063 [Candidatus Lokiarchaeota archaeon]
MIKEQSKNKKSLLDLKKRYSQKEKIIKYGMTYRDHKKMKHHYPNAAGEPHQNFLYALLCLIYDGYQNINKLKSKMRILFISSTRQLVIEDQDMEEYIQIANEKELVCQKTKDNIIIALTFFREFSLYSKIVGLG